MKTKSWSAARWCLFCKTSLVVIGLSLMLWSSMAQAAATVPFMVQAPGAKWSEPKFQDGCEEASALMAIKWAKHQTVGNQTSQSRELLAMADWQLQHYGEFRDSSAKDTAERLLKKYGGLKDVSVESKVTKDAIIKKLQLGKIILVPTDGRQLKNPYYTQPGPSTHMLVITGYDGRRQQFITNDSGTKRGANYRYPAKVLMAAINDYPTGNHLERASSSLKMIVVGQEKNEAKKK